MVPGPVHDEVAAVVENLFIKCGQAYLKVLVVKPVSGDVGDIKFILIV